MVFVNPGLWKDPFEKMYLDTDYSELGFVLPKIYCMCLTTTLQNEEAAWKVYSDKDEKTIRAKINTVTLFEILSDFALKNNYTIYFGNANYKLSKFEIQDLHSIDSENYSAFFEPFSLEKYLEIMTLKRRAFKYENELRIFIVPNKGNKYSENLLKIKIPTDKYSLLFTFFTIQPFDKITLIDYKSKIEIKKQESEKTEIAKNIKSFYVNAKISNSTLYDECNPVEKVYKIK